MNYKVWFSIDQCYLIEADSKEEAREKILKGEFGNEDIIKEENHEWISTEEA